MFPLHATMESLIDFVEGRLSWDKRQSVERHVETCSLCVAEAREWASLLNLTRTPVLESAPKSALHQCFAIYQIPKPVSKIREVFATILMNSAMAPATAGVRGAADCQQLVLQAADVNMHIRVGGRAILGQLLERSTKRYLTGVPVSLIINSQQVETTITDALGEFRFGTAPVRSVRVSADLPLFRVIGDFDINLWSSNQ